MTEQTDTPDPTAPCICDPAGGDRCPCAGRIPLAQCPCYGYKVRRADEVAAEDPADTTPVAGETFRFTFTVTPIDDIDAQTVIDDMRRRFGRKPLIHVIGRQPSSTHVKDAPGADREIPESAIFAANDLSYGGKRLTRLHAKAVLEAALPHLTAERDAETKRLTGLIAHLVFAAIGRYAFGESPDIQVDAAVKAINAMCTDDDERDAETAALRAENEKLAELWHEVVDTPQDGGEAQIWLRRWMTSGSSIADDPAEYGDAWFIGVEQVHEVIRAYLVANNLPVPAAVLADPAPSTPAAQETPHA